MYDDALDKYAQAAGYPDFGAYLRAELPSPFC